MYFNNSFIICLIIVSRLKYIHVFIKQTYSTKILFTEIWNSIIFLVNSNLRLHQFMYMRNDTSLLIFNNSWTCNILKTWSHKRSHGLVQVLMSCFTKSTRLYYKWHGIAEGEVYSTENVIGSFWCVSVYLQKYKARMGRRHSKVLVSSAKQKP